MSSVGIESPKATARQESPAPDTSGDLTLFHRGLAELCRTGVPLPRALRTLHGDLECGALRHECEAMAREVENGEPWDAVYGRRAAQFPPIYRALVEAGIASGDLPGVLDEIATHADQRAWVSDRLRRRLGYPLFAAAIVLALGMALVIGVAPMTLGAVAGGAGLVQTSPSMLFVGCAFSGLLVLVVLIALGTAFVRRPLDPGAGPHGLLFRLPLVGRLRCHAAKACFASTMAMLLRRQLPLDRALHLCAETCDDAEMRSQVERMAQCAAQGQGLGPTLRAGNLIPPSLLWFVEAAPSGEGAVRALEDLAAIYRQRLERAVDRVAVFAVPLVEVGVGAVVLVFAVGYVLPAYEVFRNVFNFGS